MNEHGTTEKPKRKPYCAIKQPLSATTIPNAQLRIGTYCEVNGVSLTTAWRRIRSGELQVVRHGTRCTRIVVPA